ncbi:MAG TPA: hypothetical protein VGE07_30875 [Herpetosiphonaceae bacterium]
MYRTPPHADPSDPFEQDPPRLRLRGCGLHYVALLVIAGVGGGSLRLILTSAVRLAGGSIAPLARGWLLPGCLLLGAVAGLLVGACHYLLAFGTLRRAGPWLLTACLGWSAAAVPVFFAPSLLALGGVFVIGLLLGYASWWRADDPDSAAWAWQATYALGLPVAWFAGTVLTFLHGVDP